MPSAAIALLELVALVVAMVATGILIVAASLVVSIVGDALLHTNPVLGVSAGALGFGLIGAEVMAFIGSVVDGGFLIAIARGMLAAIMLAAVFGGLGMLFGILIEIGERVTGEKLVSATPQD